MLCPSGCLSVTCQYCIKTAEHLTMQLMPHGSTGTMCFLLPETQRLPPCSQCSSSDDSNDSSLQHHGCCLSLCLESSHCSGKAMSSQYSIISFFTARAMYCKRCISYGNSVCLSVRPSVRLSVRPSHAGIVSKRRHVARCSLHRWIAKCV